jgi:hypothetical protein
MPTLNIAKYSQEAGEPLAASAPYTGLWLLVEYNYDWEAKALPAANQLPEAVKNLLLKLSKTLPNARVQFIKGKSDEQENYNFYFAHAHPTKPLLYHFQLNSFEDLLDLDFTALADGSFEHNRSDERLFLVCTNGKRDICCAKQGVPLYRAMGMIDYSHVWQTTHFGGHRLAATLVCLPHGICYGRVPVSEAAALMEAYHQNRILTQYYRGSVTYDSPAQAVESYLREQTGDQALYAFKFIEQLDDGEDRWQVTFEDRQGVQHRLSVYAHESSFGVYGSTTDTEPHPITLYSVEA